MKRKETITKLNRFVGRDLRKLAELYNVTVLKGGKKNEGWADMS
ncbi:MAG: hypothetical protein ACOC6P_02595 [Candidatus Aminicenantaceae bacterium]